MDAIRGVIRKMFPAKTLKQVIGQNVSISQQMIERIELWGAMYRGQGPWVDDQVDSLQIEQGICREFANVCLNEMESSISNEQLDKIYQAAIRELNENLQVGIGLGSFCIKPLGGSAAEYVTADRFVPIAFDARGRLTSVVFIQVKRISEDNFYLRFEFHEWNQDLTLRIQNKAYHTSNPISIGSPVDLSVVEEWAGLPDDVMYIGVDRPDFGYYRNPIKNEVDGSFCGVSIYDSAINLIKKTDVQFGRLDWEFESGERAVHVDVTALHPTPAISGGKSKLVLPKLNKRLYRGLNISKSNGEELYEEYSPEFRDQSIINGLNAYLRRIEFNVGLSYGDLSDVNDVDKTATEAKIAKKRKYNMVKAIQSNLKDCLEDLAYALAFYNGMTRSGYEFLCTFKDSILVDEEEERQQDRNDVAMGVMRLEEYRAKWYGETLEEAAKNLPEVAAVEE
ncbi:phage portal protein [Enterocloster lavalensis]|uniref:phage capsid protein n=1 Tax=Enterocloster lavalensis TaxID=460384 RepID=UPI000D1A1EED|nr:phage capsid protein [Enterocloster lavalensis]PST30273.1 phage capsid protein [Enterocloster lavalensis]